MPRELTVQERTEQEANYFAAHLLVPTNMLLAEMEHFDRRFDLSEDDGTLDKLAKKFAVSRNLIAFRLSEEGFFESK